MLFVSKNGDGSSDLLPQLGVSTAELPAGSVVVAVFNDLGPTPRVYNKTER